ncbi:chemotaxis protein CheW [Devosia ginsengisoli]|uniref:chemotaxis protein CheW n=1 Tax=Devosia ginsengisoli TaxID=400770 RepID=UPI0026EA8F91|nr:chemotaxis protein CheW [Devosia ginsengisoli]
MRPIARLPQAPPHPLGTIDVRGQGVPVLDLRLTLGMVPADDTEYTRIVVLCVAGKEGQVTLGLRADRVFEVTVLDSEDPSIHHPPAMRAGEAAIASQASDAATVVSSPCSISTISWATPPVLSAAPPDP